MKKCPNCGMANSDTVVCIFCMEPLEKVRDDPEQGPKLPEFTVLNVAGSPFGNRQLAAFQNVLEESKKRKK